MAGRPCARAGQVTVVPALTVRGLHGTVVIDCAVEELRRAWQSTEVV
jgi:sirohydrochlorin ferrochelatase